MTTTTIDRTQTITGTDALALLKRAVEERGEDYVYPAELKGPRPGDLREVSETTCRYFTDGAPSCIAGQALAYLGFTQADLAPHENRGASYVFEALGLNMTRAAVYGFEAAQGAQDSGQPWGEALKDATENVEWVTRHYNES